MAVAPNAGIFNFREVNHIVRKNVIQLSTCCVDSSDTKHNDGIIPQAKGGVRINNNCPVLSPR